MIARIRRRVPDVAQTAERAWQADRDFEITRSIASGLGSRPSRWWFYESDRPDLAQDAGSDTYCHLREPDHPIHRRAADRLRYLAASGLLTTGEIAAIRAGGGPRYLWRQRVLDEVDL